MPSSPQTPDIYEDTCLHPLILADKICDELQQPDGPDLRETLGKVLEEKACEKFRKDPAFRDKLASCRNKKPGPGKAEEARDWLISEMREWAKNPPAPNHFSYFDEARAAEYRLPLFKGPGIDGPKGKATAFLIDDNYDHFLDVTAPIESRFGVHDSYHGENAAWGGYELEENDLPAFKEAWSEAFTKMGYTIGEWETHPWNSSEE